MNEEPKKIVCKASSWFLVRAIGMLLMFSFFAVLFYVDGTTGYQKKNLTYFTYQAFEEATQTFAEMDAEQALTAKAWKKFASQQKVKLPEDRSVLPRDLETPMPWPEILTDYNKVKPLQMNLLWDEYSEQKELDSTPPEKPFDAGKIREQIVVFYICLGLVAISLFFLLRTLRRSMSVDRKALTTVRGKVVSYKEMKTLDLRKWPNKGLAYITYDSGQGSQRVRIDGMTYGGFKMAEGEPAEALMTRIRENFSGELIEYTAAEDAEIAEDAASQPNADHKKLER